MLSRTTTRVHLAALLAALALACLALWAGPAAAAAPTSLTATAAPMAVVYPGSAIVGGVVSTGSAPLPGAALSLLAKPAGAADWDPEPASTTKAGTDGSYRFTVKPSVSTDYRVVLAATTDQDAAQADASVQVRPLITTSFPASLWLGGTVSLRGSVAPAHPGGTVVIERRVDAGWQQLGTATLGTDSGFAFRWHPDAFGYYRVRACMDADAEHDRGISRAKLVTVNRPNAHRVPMRYAHYIVIVRHEYRLYYYEHGVLVRGFDVALGRPGYRTPLGYFHIYGKRKPAGGPLGACAMFYRHLGGIAIHGTDRPYLIRHPVPRDFSHGCARMLNHQVLWLYTRVPAGTRVHNLP